MTTIGGRCAAKREEMGLSQAGLARRIGVKPQSIQQLEAGQVEHPHYLLELARALGERPEWLLYGEAAGPPGGRTPGPRPPGARDLPVLGSAVGGDDVIGDLNGPANEFVARPPVLAAVDNAFALYVTGESMEPRYFAGEIIYVNPNRPVTPGCFVVVELADHRGFVKRLVRRTAKAVVVEQYNPPKRLEYPSATVLRLHRIVQAGDP
jgi:phage repressor protein C with HTH and peptisase S24 domain